MNLEKPKRGRKPNKVPVVSIEIDCLSNEGDECESPIVASEEDGVSKPLPKKRGRKPKGGKIVQQVSLMEALPPPKQNVILHLKCCMNDLQTGSATQIESFNFPLNKNDLSFVILDPTENAVTGSYSNNEIVDDPSGTVTVVQKEKSCADETDDMFSSKNTKKEIWKKIKVLERNLHNNNVENKKSCCFWDTHDFDTPPVFIPKFFSKDTYNVYGCFCSPECAAAHLMKENIDSSVKFERYHLLNFIYGKINDYNVNIKPAPDPHYMLERFCGNLTIQEYRSLLKTERLFLIIDKPLSRVLPELHEDNDDFILNNKVIPSNAQHTKKKAQVKPQDRFGLID